MKPSTYNAAKKLVMQKTFRTRKVGAKKGKGSYERKPKHREVNYA